MSSFIGFLFLWMYLVFPQRNLPVPCIKVTGLELQWGRGFMWSTARAVAEEVAGWNTWIFFFNWSIIALQCCFYCTITCISYVCAQSLSHVQLFAAPWTVASQTPLSLGYASKNTRVGCCFLLKGWISYKYAYIPSLLSLPPTHPSRSSQSTKLSSLCHTEASH